MIQYRIEIFDRSFNVISHTNASDVQYSFDYLSPSSNALEIPICDVQKGDYIRIINDDTESEYFGIVKAIEQKKEKVISVTYDHFLSIFDTDVLFDTDLQGTSTLETVLSNMAKAMFVNNSDTSMNVYGLSVATSGSTSSWGFNLKSDTENKHHCIVNFYKTFVVRALEKYSVRFLVEPNFQAKTITLTIGKVTAATKTVEAELPNITRKSVVIKKTSNDTNKLVVYNAENYTTTKVFYLHANGTYDTINSNRITPVIQKIKAVSLEMSGGTFDTAANSEAADVFGSIEYNNLIELEMHEDDSMIKPLTMQIGQVVDVIYEGNTYRSMLTGVSFKDKMSVLTFGTIRLSLTKK